MAIAIAGLSAFGQSAKADTVTFMQMFQVDTADKPWTFSNPGHAPVTFSVGDLTKPATTGELVILNVSPIVGGSGIVLAKETALLTAAPGTASVGGGKFSQGLLTGEIKYTDLTGTLVYLDVKVSSSSLAGQSKSGALSGSKAPNVVTFSSTVFPIINTLTDQNYAISLSSITPPPTALNHGYLTSFKASGSGTFAGAPVPEPATLALAFSALPVLGIVYLRRRRAQA
jgi:hypothetical protein